MEQDPDLDLVRDLLSADPGRRRRALGELYERHRRRVFNVAYRVLGDWNGAQDLAQEVFLHLADRIGSFRGEATLTSWLYRVTVNRAIDSRRRDARRPAWKVGEGPIDEEVRRPADPAQPVPPPEALDRAERAREVHRALQRVSPKLRAILVLRYVEGLSYDELREVLGCSLGTVKSRLSRAHAAFQRAMDDAGGPAIR
jgi:RNA polymerase sigma-70 factor (ECF subfamily)